MILITGCMGQKQTENTVINQLSINQDLRIAEIDLPGMFCFSCAYSAKRTFKGMDGVIEATVDSDTKKGKVIYDAKIIRKEELIERRLIQAYEGKIINDQQYEGINYENK